MSKVEELAQDITRVNMEKRSERTLQFYGLRSGWEWKRTHKKTRDPTAKIKSTFGHDLDPISLLGLHPTHPVRPPTVYDQRWEIVDLGRNRKVAQALLEALNDEAQLERRKRYHLNRNMKQTVRQWIDGHVTNLGKDRDEVCKRIQNGDFAYVMHSYRGSMKTLAIKESWSEHLKKLDALIPADDEVVDNKTLLASITIVLGEIEAQLCYRDREPCMHADNMFDAVRAVYSREGLFAAQEEFSGLRKTVAEVVDARKEIEARYATLSIPTDLRL